MAQKIIGFILFVFLLMSCQSNSTSDTVTSEKILPIYGERYFEESIQDTVYHIIPHFHLTNHQNENFCSDTLSGKVYLADFFFTHCPSMCPKMTSALPTHISLPLFLLT